MAEESKTLRHTAEEIDDAIDRLPGDGNAAGVYESSLAFSDIVNDGDVTQEQIAEINAIRAAWKAGKMVYAVDENGSYLNLGVLSAQIASDNTEASFMAFDQSRRLCVFRCDPTESRAKWSVYPVGKDLFALIEHTHVAGDITEESDKNFMTDDEKSKLDSIDLSQYANADLSNAMTVSLGSNGYAKFNNGLLIQWGSVGGSSTASYGVTMPTSFSNTEYKVFATVYKPSSDSAIYSASPLATSKTVSRFYINRNYASGGTTGLSQESWDWIAIGKWK